MITEDKIREAAEKYLDSLKTVSKNEFESVPLAFQNGAKWMQEQDRWISVGNKLPKNRERVIGFQSEDNGELHNILDLFYIDKIFFSAPTDGSYHNKIEIHITHWQPINPPQNK